MRITLLLVCLGALVALTAASVSADTCVGGSFYWATGPWSDCTPSGTQCAGTQSREIYCRCNNVNVAAVNCSPIPGGEPKKVRSCGTGGSFYWATDAWTDCALPDGQICGIPTQSRLAHCKCGQSNVDDLYCLTSPGAKPALVRACEEILCDID